MPLTIPETLAPVLKSRYPHRPRALYLLRRRADASGEAFEEALRTWRQLKKHEVKFGSVNARAGVAITGRQEAISGLFRRSGVEVSPIDGYVSLDVESYAPTAADFETLFRAADKCLDSVYSVVDLPASVAFAGIANLAIPGAAPTSMILILDRAPGLSLKTYNEWWVHHADDHRRMNPGQAGYHQLHIDPDLNAVAAKAAGASTMDCCIIDMMYLGRFEDAFSKATDPSSEEARRLSAEIAAHVSRAKVSGSFMKEV